MILTEKQKILLFQIAMDSTSLNDRGLFSLEREQRLSLVNQIINQQDDSQNDKNEE